MKLGASHTNRSYLIFSFFIYLNTQLNFYLFTSGGFVNFRYQAIRAYNTKGQKGLPRVLLVSRVAGAALNIPVPRCRGCGPRWEEDRWTDVVNRVHLICFNGRRRRIRSSSWYSFPADVPSGLPSNLLCEISLRGRLSKLKELARLLCTKLN